LFNEVKLGRSWEEFSLADLRHNYVDWLARVVEAWRDKDDATGACHTCKAENPQEDPVEHHRHILPVIGNLVVSVLILNVLCNKSHGVDCFLKVRLLFLY